MKQFRPLYLLAGLVAVVLFGSCQKELEPREQDGAETATQFVDFSAELDEVDLRSLISLESGDEADAEDMRMAIDNRVKDSRNNGAAFRFTNNEKVKLHLFFQQGSVIAKTSQDVRVTLTTDGKAKISNANIGVPSTINLANGGVTVTGAIGVRNPHVQSGRMRVDVPSVSEFMLENETYVVPMYFPTTSVEELASGRYGFFTTFKFYGSIVGVPLENAQRVAFKLKELGVKTTAFHTEGTMDLTNSATAVPTWTSTQSLGTIWTVSMPNSDGYLEVASGSATKPTQVWYFFWVRPTNTLGKTPTMTLDFTPKRANPNKLIQEAGSVLTAEISVNKPLVEQLVHRTPKIQLPKLGDLIISEVYRGGQNTIFAAYEFYNASDEDVNLWDYQLASYDKGGVLKATSPLLEYNTPTLGGLSNNGRLDVLRDRNEGLNAGDAFGGGSPNPPYLETKVILKPGYSAVFVSKDVQHRKDIIDPHKKCTYVFNYKATLAPGFDLRSDGGYVVLQRKEKRGARGQVIQAKEVVDVFLKLKSGQGFNIWNYTMMRKPDRNMARRDYMQVGTDTDWVVRQGSENIDWGSRFAFYQTGATNAGIKWVNGSGWQNGYAQSRPMYHFESAPTSKNYAQSPQGTSQYVKFPDGWTQVVATDN